MCVRIHTFKHLKISSDEFKFAFVKETSICTNFSTLLGKTWSTLVSAVVLCPFWLLLLSWFAVIVVGTLAICCDDDDDDDDDVVGRTGGLRMLSKCDQKANNDRSVLVESVILISTYLAVLDFSFLLVGNFLFLNVFVLCYFSSTLNQISNYKS